MKNKTASLGAAGMSCFARIGALATVCLLALASPSFAILMTFDSPGYSLGNVIGQGAGTTKWTSGYGSNLQVVNDTVTGSGQMLQVATVGFTNAYFNPTTADLGGLAFSNTTSEIRFSLDLAMTTVGSGTESRLYIGNGTSAPFMLEFEGNGLLLFKSGATSYYATKDGSANTVGTGNTVVTAAANSWVNIQATLNYATNTYKLAVNGVDQNLGATVTSLGFANTTSANLTQNLLLTTNNGSTGVSFNNLSLGTAAPLYWDGNGTSAGAGTTPTGTWGTSNFWNTDPTGGAGGAFQTSTTIADDVFFAAGSDATGTYTVTLNGTQSARSLTFNNGTVTLTGGNLKIGSGGITVNSGVAGNVNITSSPTLEASQTWTNASVKNLTFNTAATVDSSLTTPVVVTISNTTTGMTTLSADVLKDNNAAGGSTTSLVVDGNNTTSGVVNVLAAQSYTGGTYIKYGNFNAMIAGAAGTGTIYLGDTVGSKSVILFGGSITLANDIVVQAGNSGVLSIGAQGTATPTFSGNITLNNTNLVRLNKNTGTAGGSVTLSGLVTGVGGFYVAADSFSGILTHANNYSGGTRIDAGTLQIGNDTALGTGSLTFNSGATGATVQSNNATARTIANAIGTFGGTTANYVYAFGAAGTGALTFTNTTDASLNGVNRIFQVDSNTTFANGFTSTNGAITKTGNSTLIFAGANTYTGTTTITTGTLQLGNGSSTGNLSTSSAIVDNANLTINRSNPVVQGTDFSAAAITGTGSFTQAGAGTTTLNAANTYAGDTTVSVGTLLANTPVSGTNTATGTGTVSVSSTGILGGTGQITPGTGQQITVANGGAIAPGAGGIGTLTINGLNTGSAVLSLTSGAKFAFELNSTGAGNFQSDKIVLQNGVSGDIAFGGNAINFTDLTSGGTLAHGQYILFSATAANNYGGSFSTDISGFVTGGLSIGTGLGVYTGSTLQLVGTDIVLNVVPEPTTWGLLAFSLTTVMVLRRRRRQ